MASPKNISSEGAPGLAEKYFFIPGRIPSLSLLELFDVCRSKELPLSLTTVGNSAFLVSLPDTADVKAVFASLGGMVKYGKCIASCPSLDVALALISQKIKTGAAHSKKRVTFGVSSYTIAQEERKENPRGATFFVQRWGIALKKELACDGASVRFVVSQKGEPALSSVVVEKNHLCQEGNAEWVLMHENGSWHVGKTSGVQEFEEYARRDYGRPNRDMKTGLLPPKLARIMVNLACVEKDGLLLDPFCGLGTILQEAVLLEHTAIAGSDIDKKNVAATKENLSWLLESIVHLDPGLRRDDKGTIIKQCDARKLASCFPKHSVDAIVTEPTLGPLLDAAHPSITQKKIAALCDLYSASFRAFREVLKPHGRVVIVFPVWMTGSKQRFIPCIDALMKRGFVNVTVPDSLHNTLSGAIERGSLVISRPDARIARELFVFEKIDTIAK